MEAVSDRRDWTRAVAEKECIATAYGEGALAAVRPFRSGPVTA